MESKHTPLSRGVRIQIKTAYAINSLQNGVVNTAFVYYDALSHIPEVVKYIYLHKAVS